MHRIGWLLVALVMFAAPAHAGSDDDDDRPGPRERAVEALVQAARKGDVGRIRRMLAKGVDVNAETEGGDIALHEAVAADKAAAVVALLAAGADPNARDSIIGSLALPMAVARGRLDIARALIRAGANVNLHNRQDGETALMKAKSVEAARLLLAHRATVDTRDRAGQTPLMHAAKRLNLELVRLLIAEKADVMLKDRGGDTALHEAAGEDSEDKRNKKDVLRALIDAGGSLSARNDNGETPLHQIMLLCEGEMFEFARLAGAALDFSNDVDLEAFTSFAHCPQEDILPIVLSYPGIPDREALLRAVYFSAINWANVGSLDKLFDLELPPDTTLAEADGFGVTKGANGLIYAAFRPNTNAALIEQLVKRGVPLEGRDAFGRTALMIAAAQSNLGAAKALLAAGANPNAQAADGTTALMSAIDQRRGDAEWRFPGGLKWGCLGRTDLLELLLRHGANPQMSDKNGKTALQWATELKCTGHAKEAGPAAVIKLLQTADRSRR